MATIPLPALQMHSFDQPDPVTQYMRMRQFVQQQQLQQQQLQAGQLENQQRQMDVQSQQAFMLAYKEAQGDPDQTQKLAAQYGAKPTALLQWQGQVVDAKLKALDLVEKQGAKAKLDADLISGSHDTVMAAPPEQRPQAYQAQLQALQQRGIDTSKFPQQYPGDDQFQLIGAVVKGHQQFVDEAAKNAKTRAKSATAASEEAKTQFYQQNPSMGAPGVPAETVSLMDYMKTPAKPVEPMHTPANYAAWKAKQEAIATEPIKTHLAIAEASARQAIADGDPKAAAQLLVSGTVAPSQLISSRKPAFAQQAFTAAAQMQPGWTATKADADFKVASSPNNVAFFGSAKSLTDKGGTLDQLADAAKDIPGNRIPVFNSIADAMKASTGSGPIAKYASILLGVADDYSKVMGGGQGSDTSRTQALKLIPVNASPAARAAALEGIRGAVMSQQNSRIGNNSVLQQMYGSGGQGSTGQPAMQPSQPQSTAPPAQAGYTRIQASDGSVHDIPSGNINKARQRDPGLQVIK